MGGGNLTRLETRKGSADSSLHGALSTPQSSRTSAWFRAFARSAPVPPRNAPERAAAHPVNRDAAQRRQTGQQWPPAGRQQ
eukprot:3025133-Pyramimonas_sp.AAC.1